MICLKAGEDLMALFIGSFNPPTLAHLEISLNLKNNFNKIIFVPVNSKNKKLINFRDRLNMLLIYKRKYSFIEADDIMLNYSYFDYRILDILNKKYHDNTIIIGSDLLKNIKLFDNNEYLLKKYIFYVISRGDDVLNIIKKDYNRFQNSFKIIDININISSTMARNMIKNNEDLTKILDDDIVSYIRNNHLYF